MASNNRSFSVLFSAPISVPGRAMELSLKLLQESRHLSPRSITFLVCVVTLLGCSGMGGAHDGLLERLAGRGPVTVSPLKDPSGNPYLAGNLLLSREMAASPELKGFIEHRGTPQALEVETSLFSPTVLTLYYPEAAEEFSLESSDATWIIEGPFALEGGKLQELARLSRDPTKSMSGSLSGGSEHSTHAERNSSLPREDGHGLSNADGSIPNHSQNATEPTALGHTGFESAASADRNTNGENSTEASPPESASPHGRERAGSAASETDPFLGRLEEAYRPHEKKISPKGFSSPSEETKQHESLSRALQEEEPFAPKSTPENEKALATVSPEKPPAPPFKPSFLPPREPLPAGTASPSTSPAERENISAEEQFLRALAEKESTNKAELTPKGDLVHYVTLQGETLSNIARWYTFDRENAKRLARINELKNPDQLSLGDIVIIPSYLVKNQRRLTESGLAAIQDRVQKNPPGGASHGIRN